MLRGFHSLSQHFRRFNIYNPSLLGLSFPIKANLNIPNSNSLVYTPSFLFGKSKLVTNNKPFDKWRILKGDKVEKLKKKN
jgi:hypothetical protein